MEPDEAVRVRNSFGFTLSISHILIVPSPNFVSKQQTIDPKSHLPDPVNNTLLDAD